MSQCRSLFLRCATLALLLASLAAAQEPLRILRRAQQVRGLLERLIFGEREHHHGLVAIACNDDWRVIFTDPIDRRGKILSRRGVSDRLHDMDRILSNHLNAIHDRESRLARIPASAQK